MTAIAFLPHQVTKMCMWKKSMCMCFCAPILNRFSFFEKSHGTA